jgi:HSP20 family protein
MSIIRWEPFKEADEFFRGINSPAFNRWMRTLGDNGPGIEWAPVADISETEKEYLVKAELPGVNREDVKVTLDNGVLCIQGERRHEKEEKGEKTHRTERFYGSFARSFTLPDNTDAAGIRAESKDGVLHVHVPKLKAEKAKPIEIKVQ